MSIEGKDNGPFIGGLHSGSVTRSFIVSRIESQMVQRMGDCPTFRPALVGLCGDGPHGLQKGQQLFPPRRTLTLPGGGTVDRLPCLALTHRFQYESNREKNMPTRDGGESTGLFHTALYREGI